MPANITFTDPRGNQWTFEGTWNFEMIGADYESKVLMGRLRPAEDGRLEPTAEKKRQVKQALHNVLTRPLMKQLPAGD